MGRRAISIFLSAVMITVMLAGCGKSSGTNAGAKAEGNAAGAQETGDGREYPKIKIKMSTTVSEQSNAAVTAKIFADSVAEASGGNIRITVYPSDQLSGGNMSKGVEMLQQGAIDCAYEPVDVLAVLDETLLAMSIPWIFDSYQEAEDCLNQEGGAYINKTLQAQGLETLGFIHNGFRQLTNSKKPVTSPADIKGMKLRVPGGEVFVQCFKAMGADPIAMSFSELFTALQQGTVDGQENGFDLIVANKFYEVQKYITAWNYSYGAFALVFNKKTWDGFDENTRALLEEKAAEACKIGCKNVVDSEEEKKQTAIDSGCEVLDLSDEQIQAFKDVLENYYQEMEGKYGAESCAAFGIK